MRAIIRALCLLFVFALPAHAATTVQENIVWYRLHLGMGVGDMAVSPAKIHSFIDKEITPAFPNGLTITESRGQWQSPEHGLIRERTTVIEIYCPDTDENWDKIEALAQRYVELYRAAQASFFVIRLPGAASTLFY